MSDPHCRPSAAARRQQVMDAAATCFCIEGFHSTSMSQIAKTANMSVGHIYRYFSGKEEIIEAIVASDVERHGQFFVQLGAEEPERAFELLIQCVDRGFAEAIDVAALKAEVAAEAGRNPKVAGLLRQQDEKALSRLRNLLARIAPERDERDLAARAEAVALLFEGLTLRIIRQPDLDQGALKGAIRLALAALVAP